MSERISQAIRQSVFLLAIAVPLAFSDWGENTFEFAKAVLLIGVTAILLVAHLVKLTHEGKLSFRRASYDLPLLLFLLALFVSSIFSLNRALSFSRLELWVWAAAISFYFVYTNNRTGSEKLLLRGLKISAIVLSLVAVLKALGLNLQNLQFDDAKDFSPIGSIVALDTFLASLLIIEVGNLKEVFSKFPIQLEKIGLAAFLRRYPLPLIYIGLLVLALVVENPLTKKIEGLGLRDSWKIAAETAKDRVLTGTGTGIFPEAFSRYRPFSLNQRENWTESYFHADSTVFHFIAIGGVISVISLLILFLRILLEARHSKFYLSLIFLVASAFVSFWSVTTIFLFFSILAEASEENDKAYLTILERYRTRNLLPHVLTFPSLVFLTIGLYSLNKIFFAEVTFRESSSLAQKGAPLLAVYESYAKTAALNPFEPRFRTAFSQITITAAEILINNAKAKNEQLTSSDLETIKNLISQSRREADAAVFLNPLSPLSFENRATFYRKISGIAPDAADLAISDYKSAIERYPSSPVLRARLGVVIRDYRADYEKALSNLTDAISLKVDYIEARIEKARTYAALEKKEAALSEYDQALAILNRKKQFLFNRDLSQHEEELIKQIEQEKDDYLKKGLGFVKEIISGAKEREKDTQTKIIESVKEIPENQNRLNVDLKENEGEATPSAEEGPAPAEESP